MSIRNFEGIFRPRSVALIGASNRANSAGLVTMENLLSGGFDGPVIPVNPKHKSVAGVLCFPDVGSLPLAPDLAVICTPPRTVPGLLSELGARGTKAAVIITAGFEASEAGKTLKHQICEAARPHMLRLVGPNCLGVISTPAGLNASFAPGNALKGGIAFVAQSGAMVATVLDWASSRNIGFSHLVSLGDMADADFGDMLDYLTLDPTTQSILLYIEAISAPRKFLSAARAASRLKPVIAIKAGRHEAAAKAASSHTGAMAGSDEVYDAVLQRAGILRVRGLEELFDAVETLAYPVSCPSAEIVILTNGGGAGVLAADAIVDCGGKLTQLSPETLKRLDPVLPATWSRNNPVDIIGDATAKRYSDALEILLESPETDAVLAINCPTAIASGTEAAKAIVAAAKGKTQPVLTNWLGGRKAEPARAIFANAGLPTYDTPAEAARGFMHVVERHRGKRTIMEVPAASGPEFTPDISRARGIIAAAAQNAETWLSPASVEGILECYDIPVARNRVAATPEQAATAARELESAVALKIISPDIQHKSDIGGVILDLEKPDAVLLAAQAMLARIRETAPRARISGFAVQQMVRRPAGFELIAGIASDPQFGPVILFGHGGTATEIIADKAIALPPLNLVLARQLMARTRIFRLLQGYRNQPPAAVDEIARVLVRLSQLACDLDAVTDLDLNPLVVDGSGVVAVDTRIRIDPAAQQPHGSRLVIRPYPRELESAETIEPLGKIRIRPIKPEDAALLAQLVCELAPEDARMRFFTSVRSLDPVALARFTQIDYDREMAFVMFSGDSSSPLLAVSRLASDPDNFRAEFAIVVRSELHRRGIGRLMMKHLIEYARDRGLSELVGEILAENHAMLSLCTELGFRLSHDSAGIARATLMLQSGNSGPQSG
jgi:acetyltransferase